MNTMWKERLKNIISEGLYLTVIGIIWVISSLPFVCVFQSINNEKHIKENFPTYNSIENATRSDGLEFSVQSGKDTKQVTVTYPDKCLLFTYEVTPNYEISWIGIHIK